MKALLDAYLNAIRRLTNRSKTSNSVGLDISKSDCKYVEIIKKNDHFSLLKWGSMSVANGDVTSTLKQINKELDQAPKQFYTSLLGQGTLIRYINMPRMPLNDLRNSFGIEADKYFPFPQDQIYTDCNILDPQGKAKQMAVMAAAAKKELIDARVKLLAEAGFSPSFIGLNAVALANIFNMVDVPGVETEKATAVLDMGESMSSLIIIADRTLRFNRDIYMGGNELTKRISNAFGLDLAEAEALKVNPQDKIQEVLEACETGVMNIVQELKLSFDYFVTEKNIELGKILLTGGGALLEGMPAIMEKGLDLPVEIWNPLNSIQVPDEIKNEDGYEKKALKYGVALGLALYEYD